MTTIFETLRKDHDLQRQLIADLLNTEGASERRIQVFEQLKSELEAHAINEERQFYVPLMCHDLTQEKARHSVAEHKELDDFIEQLDEYELGAPQFLVTSRELSDRLLHHLEEEEREVFQLAGKVLSQQEKTELASAYRAAMADARGATQAPRTMSAP